MSRLSWLCSAIAAMVVGCSSHVVPVTAMVAKGDLEGACMAVQVPATVEVDMTELELADVVRQRVAPKLRVRAESGQVLRQRLRQRPFDDDAPGVLRARHEKAETYDPFFEQQVIFFDLEAPPEAGARVVGLGDPVVAGWTRRWVTELVPASWVYKQPRGVVGHLLDLLAGVTLDTIRVTPDGRGLDILGQGRARLVKVPLSPATARLSRMLDQGRCEDGWGGGCQAAFLYGKEPLSRDAAGMSVELSYQWSDCSLSDVVLIKMDEVDAGVINTRFASGALSADALETGPTASTRRPEAKQAGCAGSDHCARYGLCATRPHPMGGACQRWAETDDERSRCEEEAKAKAAQSGPAWSCLASRADDCSESEACRTNGECGVVDGHCVPRGDDDCRASEHCASHGWCSLVDGSCQAKDEASCRASALCRTWGWCRLVEGDCLR